jgi:hypothetical protein
MMRIGKKSWAFLLIVLLQFSVFPFKHAHSSTLGGTTGFLKYEVQDAYAANITHTIAIHNIAKRGIIQGELYVPLIRNVTARHLTLVEIVSSDGVPPKILDDSHGNLYAWWNNIVIAPMETFEVEIQYYTFSFTVQFKVDSSLVKPYDVESAIYKQYTSPEEYVESDDPLIVSTAKTIVAGFGKTDYHAMVREIYRFVVNHLSYKLQQEERGALWALEHRQGDCSEYSYLFVALCRAVGIPARIQAGFAFSSYNEETENGHMWAEYYLEGYGWIPVDASWRLFDKIDGKHFSSLQSVPEYIPYANYEFNYSGVPPKDEHLISFSKTSAAILEDFNLAKTLFQAISELEVAEMAFILSKITGAWLLFPYEYKQVEKSLMEGKLLLQNSLDYWNELTAEQAWEKIKEVKKTAHQMFFNTMAVYVGGFLFLMIIIVAVILRRQRIIEENVIGNLNLEVEEDLEIECLNYFFS